MQEEWAELIGYPHYAVSTFGRILNINRDRVLATNINSQGISFVTLLDAEGVRVTRSVAILVASTFVDGYSLIFNAPINLNGDRRDCRVQNLMWRPRWFAVRYHRQFSIPEFHTLKRPIELVDTQEMFTGVKPPCIKYGLFYRNVILSCQNELMRIFPTGHRFRFV